MASSVEVRVPFLDPETGRIRRVAGSSEHEAEGNRAPDDEIHPSQGDARYIFAARKCCSSQRPAFAAPVDYWAGPWTSGEMTDDLLSTPRRYANVALFRPEVVRAVRQRNTAVAAATGQCKSGSS